VHVLPAPPTANGVVYEQVVPVMLYGPPTPSNISAVIASGLPPVFLTVTLLVTAARDAGIVKVNVRTPAKVDSVPLVAPVKLSVPGGATAVPLRLTGEPVTTTPVKATVSVRLMVPLSVPVGANLTLYVQEAPTASVAPQVPPAAPGARENDTGVPPPNVRVPPASATLPVLVTVSVWAALTVPSDWLAKVSELGVTVAVATSAIAVPSKATGEPITAVPV